MITFLDLQNDIIQDLDLLNANFIEVPEIKRHINSAATFASTLIHNLYEDYYLATANFNIINGVQDYDLPDDIYAQKIRRIIYDDGSKRYPVIRLTDINDIPDILSTWDFTYMLINNAVNGIKVRFLPTPGFSANTIIQCWYIRETKKLVNDTDVLDIPEFVDFVKADAKLRILTKDPANPILDIIKADRAEQMNLMIQTLQKRVPDDQGELRQDVRFYLDSIA